MGISAVKGTIINFISFKFNYLKNINALKLRSVRSQDNYIEQVLFIIQSFLFLLKFNIRHMNILKDFKEFAVKGNVMDLAVGVIIGAAFGKIISSLVSDVIMPPIGVLVGGIDFKNIVVTLQNAVVEPASGKILKEAVTLKIGGFIQTVVDFIIVAFTVFLMIKGLNKLTRKKPEAPPVSSPPLSKDQELLTEIRDLLKK